MTPARPSLRNERALQREGHRVLCGMDEVGRGALAGPVSVGAVVIDERSRTAPQGVRDSKLLTAAARERLVPRLRSWAVAYAVGHSSAAEIDMVGIMAALQLAGRRALSMLDVVPDLVILDGNYDWLSPRVETLSLFPADDLSDARKRQVANRDPGGTVPAVLTMVKADMKCSSVAAASVLAKVERDGLLCAAHERYPQFNWAGNKGYSAPEHLAAIERHGSCELHRRSWRPFVVAVPARQDGALNIDAISTVKERV